MIGLTRAEAACLSFIEAFHAREGIMPSRREITAVLHYKSTSNSVRLVYALVERGRLRLISRRARALELVTHVNCPGCGHNFESSLPGREPAGEARGRTAPQPQAARATSFLPGDA